MDRLTELPERLSLDGDDWQVKWYVGDDWIWRNAEKPTTRDTRHWMPATVPGSVHHDLWKNGQIPNPYFERNTLQAEWASDRTWVYKKTFQLREVYRGRQMQLVFEGVDYEAQFFLNGERLGHHVGMYTPVTFAVEHLLNFDGENLLAVVIEPAPHEQPQVGRSSLVRTHKSRMTYWWDFCPRLVHLGIWDAVYLTATGRVRLEDVFVRPTLNADYSRANVLVTVRILASESVSADVDVSMSFADQIVVSRKAQHTLNAGTTDLTFDLPVDAPRLWWTNGSGEQPLYELVVRVTDAEQNVISESRRLDIGIRDVEFVANQTADPTALPYTLVVNGRKTYINGWNWVPIDMMYGVARPEKLRRLLELVRRAHVNMLRVWGGGLIEKEAFYNLCDQFGILVWQEFIQSSSGIENLPPDDPAMIEFMVRDAEQIIPRKRNHPSLAIWCGGNELQYGEEQPADDKHPLLKALGDVARRLDPDRLWLPTSPTGRVFMNSLANVERDPTALHDVHGPWEHQGLTGQYTLYNRTTSLLHSEFGAEGITNLQTLRSVISDERLYPVSLDNPIWEHLGAWWVKLPRWRESLGDIEDLEMLVRGTQFLQAEGVRYAVEANRRRQWQNSGSLPWQFNEPYPMAACTSAVDYYGQPKPLYYAVARAYEPVHVSARFETQSWVDRTQFEAEVWVSSALLEPFEAMLAARVIGASGTVYAEQTASVRLPANGSLRLLQFSADLSPVDDLFFLDLTLDRGGQISENRYLFTRQANLHHAFQQLPTTLDVDIEKSSDRPREEWTIRLTNTGDHTALLVWLEDGRPLDAEGYVYFDRNHFSLFPGESVVVRAEWDSEAAGDAQIRLSGWNVPEQLLT